MSPFGSSINRAFSAACLAILFLGQSVSAADPPNVIVVLVDDLGWKDLGCQGSSFYKTPHIDALASRGLRFTHAYAACAVCSPTRAALLTGKYPTRVGITDWIRSRSDENKIEQRARETGEFLANDNHPLLTPPNQPHLPLEETTLAELFKANNYATAHIGKWHLGGPGHLPSDQGFDRNIGGYEFGQPPSYFDPYANNRRADGIPTLSPRKQGEYLTDREADEAVAFIEAHRDRPFFLSYWPYAVHTPLQAKTPDVQAFAASADNRSDQSNPIYAAMIQSLDSAIGRIVEALEKQDITNNTLIVFTSDNGGLATVDRLDGPTSNAPLRSGKGYPYEGGIRVPLIMTWPGVIPPGKTSSAMVGTIDLLPTLQQAAQLSAGTSEKNENIDGISLWDHVTAGGETPLDRDELLWHFPHYRTPDVIPYSIIRQGPWKLVKRYEGPTFELFNLAEDPTEQHDLASDNPDRVARLDERLSERLAEIGAKIPRFREAASDPTPPKATSTDAPPPNILFFLSDDQRDSFMGCAGHPFLQTPAMDSLAKRGVRFENAFVTTSICAASRATLLTGVVERTHRFTFGTPPIADSFCQKSYPALLRESGYRTGLIGKFGVEMSPANRQLLFDTLTDLHRAPYFKPQPNGESRHVDDLIGDAAIEFIQANKKQPFCLQVCFNSPHAEDNDHANLYPPTPSAAGLYQEIPMPQPPLADTEIFEALPEFLQTSLNRKRWFWQFDTPEKYDRNVRDYYRMISGIDSVMARVLKSLDETGLAENTIVIFSSDNGYFVGERGLSGKWIHYEESLRVPLIIVDPRQADATNLVATNRVAKETVLNLDIPATILDLAGAMIPASYQGRSLKPILAGGPLSEWREDFFAEHLMEHPDLPKWEGIRSDRYTYANYFQQHPPFEFLHDRQRDPKQLKNRINDPEYQEIRDQLRARTHELRDAFGGPFQPAPPRATPKRRVPMPANTAN